MKPVLKAIIIFALVGSLVAGMQTVEATEADLEIIFSEDFYSSFVDSTKWIVQENTNVSVIWHMEAKLN